MVYTISNLKRVDRQLNTNTMVNTATYKVRLAKIKMTATIVSIDDDTFEGWTSVKKITLPSRITTLGYGVFAGCSSLTSVKMGRNVTTIGENVFINCSSLTSIELPLTITTLGDGVFQGCSSLTSVTLPLMITNLGDKFFYNCVSLSHVSLPPQITHLGDTAFYGCSSLRSITLPSTITSLGHGVFQGCSSLTTVTLPPEIKSLNVGLFWDCASLTSITLPSKITTIENDVFSRCAALTTIRMQGHPTAISSRAFNGCARLTTIEAPHFSTSTNFSNDSNSFQELLVDAGYTEGNPDDFLYYDGQPPSDKRDMYYDKKVWARTEGWLYRLPLCIAAEKSMKWVEMQQIFAANMPAIYEVDWLTGLPLFMMAAVGPNSDLESVYNLLKQHPLGIGTMKERKEGRGEWVQGDDVMMPLSLKEKPTDDMIARLFNWKFCMD